MGAEEALFNLIKTYGISSATSLAVVISIWRAMSWLGTNVVTPLTNRQMRFFDNLETSSDQQAKAMEILVRTVDLQTRNIEQLSHVVETVKSSMLTQEALMRKLCDERQSSK